MNLAIFEAVKVMVEVFKDFELEFEDGWWVVPFRGYINDALSFYTIMYAISPSIKNRLENVPKSETIEGITSRYQVPAYRPSLTLHMKNPMMISVEHRKNWNQAILSLVTLSALLYFISHWRRPVLHILIIPIVDSYVLTKFSFNTACNVGACIRRKLSKKKKN